MAALNNNSCCIQFLYKRFVLKVSISYRLYKKTITILILIIILCAHLNSVCLRREVPLTPDLRSRYDLPAAEKSWNRGLVVERTHDYIVTYVVGDRQGKISRSKVDGHVQNFQPAIPNRLVPRLIVRSVVGRND